MSTSSAIRSSVAELAYNSYNVSSENLVLDQLTIPKLIFFSILITYLVDIILILQGETLSWLLVEVKGAMLNETNHFKTWVAFQKIRISVNSLRLVIFIVSCCKRLPTISQTYLAK